MLLAFKRKNGSSIVLFKLPIQPIAEVLVIASLSTILEQAPARKLLDTWMLISKIIKHQLKVQSNKKEFMQTVKSDSRKGKKILGECLNLNQ